MKQVFDAARSRYIHDFDGVHYSYEHIPDINGILAEIKADVVSDLLPHLSFEEAKHLGKTSYEIHGDGLKLLTLEAIASGHDGDEFMHHLHIEYHARSYERFMADYADAFSPCARTNRSFADMAGFVEHGVLTQGCLTGWTKPLLSKLGRLEFFNEKQMIGFFETDFTPKAVSERPIAQALEIMQAEPEQAVFIEDSLPNIKTAKQYAPKLLTVFIAANQNTVPECVDYTFPSLQEFMAFAATHYPKAGL